MDYKDTDIVDSPEEPSSDTTLPDWVKSLEPVRKLPTNVGTRIRKCVYEALEREPPEWAKKILEHSISKEVYKGNASGPTKVCKVPSTKWEKSFFCCTSLYSAFLIIFLNMGPEYLIIRYMFYYVFTQSGEPYDMFVLLVCYMLWTVGTSKG